MTNHWTKAAVVVVVLGVAVGCLEEGETDPGLLEQHQAISACGGFEETLPPETGGADDYCAAEVLDWAYDAATQVLELTDARALLNCCGERTMGMSLVEGVYVVSELDSAEGGMGRCDCMCVFDLRLTVEGLLGGILPVRVERLVTDEASAPAVVWEGELDLGLGAGAVVLDATDVGMWCRDGA
jgi:hypothetical protein